MTAITDQQRQDTTPSPTDFVTALQNIEEVAAELLETSEEDLTDDKVLEVLATTLEMIEGLAQAVRQLYIQQTQGWAPVLEDKR